MHDHCLRFAFGYAVVPREIDDRGYAFFFDGGDGGGPG